MAIKVLIVDDSAVMRSLLTELIAGAPDLVVVGAAPDPLAAREMIKSLNPDVLTLDVEMPKMDGLDFLERLMRLRPMPVVMISTLTEKGSETTLRALELGAVDFLAKPGRSAGILDYGEEIRDKIRAAHQARIRTRSRNDGAETRRESLQVRLDQRAVSERLILIGASTGGTEAIKDVLTGLPGQCPPVLMVQHMPEMFWARSRGGWTDCANSRSRKPSTARLCGRVWPISRPVTPTCCWFGGVGRCSANCRVESR